MFFSIVYNFRSYLILMVCGFLAGILLFCKIDISFAVYGFIFLTVLGILLIIQLLFYYIKKERIPRLCFLTLLFIVFMITGAARTATVEYGLNNILREIGDDEVLFSGRVISSPEKIKTSDRKWVYVKLSSYLNNGEEKR